MSEIATDVALIGHNNPPELTPFELSRDEIDGLFAEAKHWLDGDPVETQAQADEIGKLIDALRKAEKLADERRIAEKAPFDYKVDEIQTRYAPLIANTKKVTGKTVMALELAKKALTPFLKKQDDEKRRIVEEARRDAEIAKLAAQEAVRAASRSGDLEQQQEAEFREQQAKEAAAFAKRTENDKAGASGGAKKITLRTRKVAKIVDFTAFSRYVWTTQRADLEEFMAGYASQLCRAGVTNLPGVEITVEEIAQ